MKRELHPLILIIALLTMMAAAPAMSAAKKPKISAKTSSEMNTGNTFSKPDFAFPQTVAGNARRELEKASASGNWLNADIAAMQLTVAANLISTDSVVESLALIRHLADTQPAPYSQLMRLLEASVYKGIYNSDRWIYDNRNLPTDSFPSNPKEWSRDLFAIRISSLVKQAASPMAEAYAMPISHIKGLVGNGCEEFCPTVYDFIVAKGCSLLDDFKGDNSGGIIPFGSATNPKRSVAGQVTALCSSLAGSVITSGATPDEKAYFTIILSSYKSDDEAIKLLKETALQMQNEPCSIILLDACYDRMRATESDEYSLRMKQFYSAATAAADRFPDYKYRNSLVNKLNSLSRASANTSMDTQYLPAAEVTGKVKLENTDRCWLLCYSIPASINRDSRKVSEIIKHGRLVKSVEAHINGGDIPFGAECGFSFGTLPAGNYYVVPSETADAGGINAHVRNNYIEPFRVSGLAVSQISDNKSGKATVYVVDGHNQKPVEGASVSVYTRVGRGDTYRLSSKLVSDREGAVSLTPDGRTTLHIKKGSDELFYNIWGIYTGSEKETESISVKFFNDLPVYRPGDTLRFSAVVYSRNGNNLRITPDKPVKIGLRDANYQLTDSITAVSDSMGRLKGEFKLPESGVLGTWCIVAENGSRNGSFGREAFQVAEYKAPTFFIDNIKTEGEYRLGDTVRITGCVKTYSGMPVADAEVSYGVRYASPWCWRGNGSPDATYGGEVKTTPDGSFAIELSTARLKDTPYAFGAYRLEVTATSQAGETQQAAPVYFSLGSALDISIMSGEMTEVPASGEVRLNVRINDITGHPMVRKAGYSLSGAAGEVVASGEFTSPSLHIDASSIPSGEYTLTISAGDDSASSQIILYRASDSRPPVKTPLWVTSNKVIVADGASKASVRVGSGYSGSYILMIISDHTGVRERRWLAVSDTIVNVDVPAPEADSRIWVSLRGMHDLDSKEEVITLIPSAQAEQLTIKTESFRSSIVPATRELWTFSFSYGGIPMPLLPAMAVMTDKALDAIAPFSWSFAPQNGNRYSNRGSLSGSQASVYNRYFTFADRRWLAVESCQGYDWNTYGYSFAGGRMAYRLTRNASAKVFSTGAVVESEEVLNEVKLTSVAIPAADADMVYEDAGSGSGSASAEEQMRPVECPLAFFYPDLVAGTDGLLKVEFDVPDFNTTWQFQLLGYTSGLKTACITLDAVASKPVMVQTLTPRFLRTGDDAVIAATLYNATDTPMPVGGRIEISDPISGRVLKTQTFAEETVEPSGSRVVRIAFAVGSSYQQLCIRAYATGGGHSDGEESIIGILPSSSPVIESAPFYLGSDTASASVKLPSFTSDASVTLQYCGNPVWYCLTSLPAFDSNSGDDIFSILSAYYGNSIAAGIAGRYPQVREAIRYWTDNPSDSMLVSKLERDAALKAFSLNNTIWVNNAQSETLRMSQLSRLLDKGYCDARLESLKGKLLEKQRRDGGWSWCPGFDSSIFATSSVILYCGMLKSMGYLPDTKELDKALRRGIAFCDKELWQDYVKSGKHYQLSSVINYLYARSCFSTSASGDFAKLQRLALADASKNWRDMGIYGKATAAIVLHRHDDSATAAQILESLRQYATVTADKGTFFDNLSSGFDGFGRLITTTQVLEAFAEINPADKMIDGLRHWLVVQRETEDWGSRQNTAEVVSALLSSGTGWLVPPSQPVISIGGKRIAIPHETLLTGEFRITLDPETASGKQLTIKREGGVPAWGAVTGRFIAPMDKVKSASVPDLKIEKAVYVVTDSDDGTSVESRDIKLGQRVRVTLTLTSGRDMDYVAITDGRPACLNPVVQTAGYSFTDGLAVYTEPRNSDTNIFIGFLPKGVHVITYDCFANLEGDYSMGIATAQSQYAPAITAHSAGGVLRVSAAKAPGKPQR